MFSERLITTWSASPSVATRPPSYPTNATVVKPRLRASTSASTMLVELPLVDIATATSPDRP